MRQFAPPPYALGCAALPLVATPGALTIVLDAARGMTLRAPPDVSAASTTLMLLRDGQLLATDTQQLAGVSAFWTRPREAGGGQFYQAIASDDSHVRFLGFGELANGCIVHSLHIAVRARGSGGARAFSLSLSLF